ncbi:hypothetical protein Tco_0377216 [Tanacetum coccineum]
MFDRREPLLDVEIFALDFEWVVPELLFVFGYDFSWQPKSTHDVVPYEFLNLVLRYRCNWLCLDPLCKFSPVGYLSRVEVSNIPCDSNMDDDSEYEADDDMGYDPSDVAITEWLGSKFFNYKMMNHYTMKALWIYWIRGNDEVELTNEESSDNKDDVAEVFRIETNIFDYETPLLLAFNEF